MSPTGAEAEPPLARLFAMAFRQLIDQLHERLRERGWTDVRGAFGFVLVAARDRPTTSTELAALLGSTKQATSKLIDNMVEAGYVRRDVGVDDARQRLVRLTPRGVELLAEVEAIYADLEGEWAAVIGGPEVERLRRDLTTVMTAANGGRLPPIRPTW